MMGFENVKNLLCLSNLCFFRGEEYVCQISCKKKNIFSSNYENV